MIIKDVFISRSDSGFSDVDIHEGRFFKEIDEFNSPPGFRKLFAEDVRSAILHNFWGLGTYHRHVEIAFAIVVSAGIEIIVPCPTGSIVDTDRYFRGNPRFSKLQYQVKSIYLSYQHAKRVLNKRQNGSVKAHNIYTGRSSQEPAWKTDKELGYPGLNEQLDKIEADYNDQDDWTHYVWGNL